MKFLFDSNPLIYFLNGALPPQGQNLIRQGMRFGAAFSVISRIEILGYEGTPQQGSAAVRLLAQLTEIDLTEAIVNQTIQLRRQYRRLKLPDAIIAATAMEYALPLITHNLSDFTCVAGLICHDPFSGGA
ncbi:MAG: type II toxin-antitoxin system VapC family toxin [Magnetococcales bacterium]|nr:type II toxin-antitoxin system VapC family toxin [Magnetococcales bacterium]MBF0116041.1 type II toxin-antitoxin system VapC family toxin [Magnetococcales bacterium]